MSFETEGIIHKIFDTENKTDKFQAREFVIKQEGNYPQFIKFQLTQDRCDLADKYKEGDSVKVSFDLRGREWNEKYFTNLNAWRIEAAAVSADKVEATGPPQAFDPLETAPLATASESKTNLAEDFEDLPF